MLTGHENIRESIRYRDVNRPGYEKCNGCRVCTLPCPVWHQTHDISLTHCGRARAIQCGASPEDIRDSIMSCILCGACESVCPFGIDTVGITIDLRHMISEGLYEEEPEHPINADPVHGGFSRWILPGKIPGADKRFLKIINDLLGDSDTGVFHDDGSDISFAVESGRPVSEKRKEHFIKSLEGAEELIVGDGILQRILKNWLPDVKITALGSAIIKNALIRESLGPHDLFIIETRKFNGDHDYMVREYDILRKETGCLMNMDLHRSAIPTGALGIGSKAVSPLEQAEWIIKGHNFKRIVAESVEDMEIFRQVSGVQVIHVLDLAGDRSQ